MDTISNRDAGYPGRCTLALSLRSPSTGLPILATEPMTAGERHTIETLAEAYVHLQARLAQALSAGTVAAGLEALGALAELGRLADQAAPLLGRGR